jgi:hypothetical protein
MNACSIGIHRGDSCATPMLQGDLLFSSTNPYNSAKYRTNDRGFSFPWSGFHGTIENIGISDFDGRPFTSK